MVAVETSNLAKRFGTVRVLEDVSLRVAEGEVYGLLGPNGAGKTTLLHLLLGFLRPERGEVRVLGLRPHLSRDRVGYLPEHARYHAYFTAREYLRALGIMSDLHGARLDERCRAVLELVGLASVANRRLGTFSKGMLQRLGIAQALLHEPGVLLIDEPTSGLDPAGQREMIDLLSALRRRGHTVLMCTHQIPEVETLCDRVGILSGCQLAAEARVADLSSSGGMAIVARPPALPESLAPMLRSLAPDVVVEGRQVRVGGDEALQARVLRALLDAGVAIHEMRPLGGGVEALYLAVIQHQTLPGQEPPRQPEPGATAVVRSGG